MKHALSPLIKTALLVAMLGSGPALSPLLAAPRPASGTEGHDMKARLPDRQLTCSVRHITNFDPEKLQTSAELQYDAVYPLTLALPGIPVRTAPPPEPQDEPEPVDPRTRILADPGNIAPTNNGTFDRAIDYWPERTELSAVIAGDLLNVIVINKYDPATQTANFFMTRAAELTRFQTNHVYQGECKVRFVASGTGKSVA
ncbi:hypothetical protein [Novosphingobium sp.]|uniref:hypothetical protein n=1 Tax=Novosphingobium sp. TaxID=1874826 RepID=UPI002620E028|nr:hypothetical protein [Novosphingobium sp.]